MIFTFTSTPVQWVWRPETLPTMVQTNLAVGFILGTSLY